MDELQNKANSLDAADPLATTRDLFDIPDGVLYLDGNSLGVLPKAVPDRVNRTLSNEWRTGLIRSWSDADWFNMPMSVGDRIAPIIGAGSAEVAVGDSTSVNIFKCLACALHLNPGRRVILAEGNNFPTDSYMAQGLAALVPDVSVRYIEAEDDPADCCGDDVAVVLLSHVDYRSARVHEMAAISRKVQAAGALILWDLSHTTGAVPCDLKAAGADMAVGCSYKYLNGGPGAPAFAWVNPKHASNVSQPLSANGLWNPADTQPGVARRSLEALG